MSAVSMAQIAALSVLVLGACQPKPPADESAAAIMAVRAADAAWLKALAGRDTTAAVAAVEATGSLLAPNSPMATGPAAIRKAFEEFYSLPGMTLTWEAVTVGAARSGEVGYSSGPYTLTFTGPKGKPLTDHGKYVTVWRKQADGTWKVVLDTWNSDLLTPGS
jgi:ketosteroid isomerase-like protein